MVLIMGKSNSLFAFACLVLTLFGCGGKSNDDGNANINIDSNSEIGIKVEFINAPEWLRTEYRLNLRCRVKAKDEDGNDILPQ